MTPHASIRLFYLLLVVFCPSRRGTSKGVTHQCLLAYVTALAYDLKHTEPELPPPQQLVYQGSGGQFPRGFVWLLIFFAKMANQAHQLPRAHISIIAQFDASRRGKRATCPFRDKKEGAHRRSVEGKKPVVNGPEIRATCRVKGG